MPSGYFSNPFIFLIDVLFGFYLAVLALRLIMQWVNWSHYNPLVQFIVNITQPPVQLLRKFIPSIGRLDTATLFLLFLVEFIKLLLIGLLQPQLFEISFLRIALVDLFKLFITLYSASIIIEIVLSWISPQDNNNPVVALTRKMNAPLLTPIRKRLPYIGGFDLSPVVVLLGLQIVSMLVLPLLLGQV